MIRKAAFGAFIGLLAILPAAAPAGAQDVVEKPRYTRDAYPLVQDTDYYCSFFVLAAEPAARVEAADSSDDKLLYADGDMVWARITAGAPPRAGEVFAVVEPLSVPAPKKGKSPAGPGPIAFRRGRLRVVRTDGDRFLARIEKSCAPLRIGALLMPFEEKAPYLGKDLGFDTVFQGGEVLTGRLTFFRDELNQVTTGDWALVDVGRTQGLKVGQQLTAYAKPAGERPARAAANVVVVDVGESTATVKVLSARDVLHLGDLVQVK